MFLREEFIFSTIISGNESPDDDNVSDGEDGGESLTPRRE